MLLQAGQLPKCLQASIDWTTVWTFTSMDALMLLDMGQLFERLVAVAARILANIRVHKRMLRQLL
jgi:hypothetical protein